MKSIKEAKLNNKRVLMRAGFDVGIDERGNIVDDTRIKEALPTIKYILKQKPKELIIISHLGRPEGKIVPKLKLNKVAERLQKLLSYCSNEVRTMESHSSRPAISASNNNNLHCSQFTYYQIANNIFLLENIRFCPEEEKNDAEFAKKLASLGEVFIFEAFSAAHREHASTASIIDFLPSYAGFEMEREVKQLSKLSSGAERPYLLVIGGAKTEDKAPVIDALKNKVDRVLIGGRTANLLHQEKKYQADEKIILNIDGINKNGGLVSVDGGDPMAIYDLGPQTIKAFKSEIKDAKTVLAAGPLGKFEEDRFAKGTEEVYQAIADSNSHKVAAGGDTIEALNKFNLFDKFNFVSTGGGAALEFIARGTLPVIEKLNKQK